jgi:hypothetical protein
MSDNLYCEDCGISVYGAKGVLKDLNRSLAGERPLHVCADCLYERWDNLREEVSVWRRQFSEMKKSMENMEAMVREFDARATKENEGEQRIGLEKLGAPNNELSTNEKTIATHAIRMAVRDLEARKHKSVAPQKYQTYDEHIRMFWNVIMKLERQAEQDLK